MSSVIGRAGGIGLLLVAGLVHAAADGGVDPESQRWEQLRATYPDTMAKSDAVPYSLQYHPEIMNAYRPVLPEIEDLRRHFVQRILESKRCKGIEQVGLDTGATQVTDNERYLAFWIDCDDGTTYHADAQQIRSGDLPAPDKKGQWHRRDARAVCEEIVRSNRPSNQRVKLVDTQVEEDHSGVFHTTVVFDLTQGQHTETHTAKCTLAPGDYPKISIQ